MPELTQLLMVVVWMESARTPRTAQTAVAALRQNNGAATMS